MCCWTQERLRDMRWTKCCKNLIPDIVQWLAIRLRTVRRLYNKCEAASLGSEVVITGIRGIYYVNCTLQSRRIFGMMRDPRMAAKYGKSVKDGGKSHPNCNIPFGCIRTLQAIFSCEVGRNQWVTAPVEEACWNAVMLR